jgi:hypothetical protein
MSCSACGAAVAHDHAPGSAPATREECEQDADDEHARAYHGGAGDAEDEQAER